MTIKHLKNHQVLDKHKFSNKEFNKAEGFQNIIHVLSTICCGSNLTPEQYQKFIIILSKLQCGSILTVEQHNFIKQFLI